MGNVILSVYPQDKICYASLVTLEGILANDYQTMSKRKFKKYYTSKRKVDMLLRDWVMPKKISIGFIHAYLEYRLGMSFEPYNFKRYVVQEDYFMYSKDLKELYVIASNEAIPCFKKHGFLYKEVE